MKRTLFLIFILLSIAGRVSCTLDFSKFHLPPCCFISTQDHFSGYSISLGRNNVNAKREISYEEVQLMKSDSQIHNLTNKTISPFPSKNKMTLKKPKSSTKNSGKIYRLVVPIGEIIVSAGETTTTTELPETTQIMPPTTGRILFPEMNNGTLMKNEVLKFKRNSNQALAKSKLLEEVITLELEDLENQKSVIGKKSLVENDYSSKELNPEHRSTSKITKTFKKWEPKKLRNLKHPISSKAIASLPSFKTTNKNHYNSDRIHSKASTTVKRQAISKMPTTWVKHLRRALYQSITAIDGMPEISLQDSSNEVLFPDIWNSIRLAKLKFIDKMSLIPTDIPTAIYLPQGEGPVVSGILVNSREGGLQLRVASELYNPKTSRGGMQDNCRCYLLNHGEILVAYWSISRIFNQNKKPALQYLVYPLPHSVPTPPELVPFSNGQMFMASPMDPLTRYYDNNLQRNYYPETNYQVPNHNEIDVNIPQRHPKLIHQLPNGHHRIEFHNNNNNMPVTQPFPFSSIPDYQDGHSGVLIEKDGQYMPEFMDIYRQAIENHFHQNSNNPGGNSFYEIPYPNLNTNGPINYENPIPTPPIAPPIPTQFVNINEEFVKQRPPILLEPDPTRFPIQSSDQISKPPTFPKSIQDIISPFPTGEPAQVPVEQEQPIPPQISYNGPALVNQQEYLNNEQDEEQLTATEPYPPTIIVQSTVRPPNKNVYNDKNNQYQDKSHDGQTDNRPYTISNVLDNEKRYYPRRKPTKINDFNSLKTPYRKKPIHDIDGTKGYILDF